MHGLFQMFFWDRVRYLRASIGCGWRVAIHCALAIQMARQEKISSCVYRWSLTTWRNNGLAISPGINLSQHIGVGEGATHTSHEGLYRTCSQTPAFLCEQLLGLWIL